MHPDWENFGRDTQPFRIAFLDRMKILVSKITPDSLMRKNRVEVQSNLAKTMVVAEKTSWQDPHDVMKFARVAGDVHVCDTVETHISMATEFVKNGMLPPSTIDLSSIRRIDPTLYYIADNEVSTYIVRKDEDLSEKIMSTLEHEAKSQKDNKKAQDSENLLSAMNVMVGENRASAANSMKNGYVPKFVAGEKKKRGK